MKWVPMDLGMGPGGIFLEIIGDNSMVGTLQFFLNNSGSNA